MVKAPRQTIFWFCLILALSISLAAIGLVILTYAPASDDPTGRMALRPGGGLVALVLSIGFAAIVLRRRYLALITAFVILLLAFLLGIVPSLQDFSAHASLQSARISPVMALAVALVAASLVAAVQFANGWLVGMFCSPLVLMIGGASVLSHWYPQLAFASLGSIPESTIVVTPLVLLCGLVLPFLFRVFRQPPLAMSTVLLLTGIIGIFITTISWHVMRLQHSEYTRLEAQNLASHIGISSSNAFAIKLALIQRLAERLQLLEAAPSDQHWQQEVTSYFRDFPEIHLITILDPQLRPMRIEARSLDDRFWLHNFLGLPGTKPWLVHLVHSGTAHMSQPYRDKAEVPYAAIGIPITPRPSKSWVVMIAIDLPYIYEGLEGDYRGDLSYLVKLNGQEVFNSAPDSAPESRIFLASSEVAAHHHSDWRVDVFTLDDTLPADQLYLPPLILFTGFGLSFLVMLSQLYWREADRRSLRLSELNNVLNFHLEEERNLRYINERIMEFSRDMLCSVTPDGVFRTISPACESILGYSPEELTGQHFDTVLLPDDRDHTVAAVRRLAAGELDKARGFRTRLRHRNGQVMTVSWTAEWSTEDSALFAVGRDITDQLAAEALMREREQFFSLSPDMFCIVDLNTRFFEVNQTFLDTLAYERHELLGTSYLKLVCDEDRPVVKTAVQSLIHGELIDNLAVRTLHKSGELRWLSINAVMSADQLIYVVARDITDFRRTQDKLQDSEALLRMAERVAQIGGWILDVSTGASVWSDAVCDIHDLPRGQAPDVKDAILYYLPEYRERITEAVRLCIDTGIPFDEELQIRSAKGRVRWVRAIGHPIKDKHGKIFKLQGAFQDITASQRAMEQIRRYAERQATMFESITDAFFTLDRQWRFIYLNNRSEELLHRTREELLGRNIWDCFPQAVNSAFDKQYHQAVETGQSVGFEAYYPPLDTWFEVSAYPSEEGLAVYYRSINERKKAQAELQHTMKELERSNRELQDFAFVASHDLQEPLRKIQAFSDRLLTKSTGFSEQEQDYLKRMQSAAGRMQALILDLLSYSRVTTKARPFVNCDTDSVLADVLQDLETVITREQARIETQPLPPIFGDPTQIRQVLQNLISNAVKFHLKDQPPQVYIYPEAEDPDGWTLVVRDEGIGFDPAYTDKLFHPFQRLHQRQEYPGTGIGMAIVKKILDRHNAGIIVESSPGAGTTFRIRFMKRTSGIRPAYD